MNQTASGRPVRFFALVMAGWIALRLFSQGGDIEGGSADRPLPPAPLTIRPVSAESSNLLNWQAVVEVTQGRERVVRHGRWNHAPPIGTMPTLFPLATQVEARFPAARPAKDPVTQAAPAINPTPALPLASPQAASPDRWHGSAWLLWRDGSATRADAVAGGRLGGSQAGVRIDFDLTPHASSRATAYARASAALNRPASPEAALGLAWQPERDIPIRFAAERRIALGKGGRDANAVMAVGGFGPVPVAPSLEIEAYAQGGMVGFRSNDLFVDGKMSLLSPVRDAPLRIGASLSGGAQPRVERLDVGPEVQLRLPIKPVAARINIEWRERIAGRAAPASGLAMTLGADF
ncbi:hypothetical protein [Sphingobium estronivorans]|uniref:hypothetical protein n=1 Tax=Sphingobium estronivorans TaxID=1577690 RepID=UPI001239098E|nr:hypothetical protein [Sphingobium estronivorans]